MVLLKPEIGSEKSKSIRASSSNLTLVGDVGGTNCRLAFAERNPSGAVTLHHTERYAVADFDHFNDVVGHFLETYDLHVNQAAFAFAGPKFDDEIRMTNLNWIVSEVELSRKFGFDKVVVINDFVAMASGAMVTPEAGFDVLIHGDPDPLKPIIVLGPGTGLGVSCVLPGDPHHFVPTEGGHTAFSPRTELECEILAYWSSRLSFVSAETLLSGPGLVRLHEAICAIQDRQCDLSLAADIVTRAGLDTNSAAYLAVTEFCSMLGGFAGDAAVMQGASGRAIIGGGVARHISKFIPQSNFVSRFKDRGSGSWYLQNTPVHLLKANFVPLYGAAVMVLDQ